MVEHPSISHSVLERGAAWPVALRTALDKLLWESYGHIATVQILASASIALLLSCTLYFLSPILEDDYHMYQQYLPWVYYFDWSPHDSFIVDHMVVFLMIALPTGWLFLLNAANSSLYTKVDLALLALRLVCCGIVAFSLTVILAEFLSRRAMVAIIALGYGSLGLVYSWSVPLWRWYMEEARAKGFIAFMPETLQHTLLRTSLLEWLTDTTFMDRLRPFLPLLLPLSKAEQNAVLEQLPVETQIMMTRPGIVALLPTIVQKLLLPSDATMSSAMVSHIRNEKLLESNTSASAGFDFHKPSETTVAVGSRKASSADSSSTDAIASTIVSKRVINACTKFLATPTPTTLNRTASISTALLLLQLYTSRRSRHAVLMMVQFAVASSLASVAAVAFLVRVMQLGHSPLLLRFLRRHLIRSTITTKVTGSLTQAKVDDGKTNISVQKAATSASVVVAVVYFVRRFRK